jgi:hypothetical protein
MMVGADGTESILGVLEGPGGPDLGAVNEVARLALQAARLGGGLVLREVSPAMRELLELAGLSSETWATVEMEGETEGGEESLGVHE